MEITKGLIEKYSIQAPRYTSYPPSPYWISLTESLYKEHLDIFSNSDKSVSLYVHIPFCETMCYYCGCNVVIRKPNDSVGGDYVSYLEKEIKLVAKNINRKPLVRQCHFGGGSPNFLSSKQLKRLWDCLHFYFEFAPDSENAIEVDPRRVDIEKLNYLRSLGFNRVSMGIQDFDPTVQSAVNRIQSFSQVQNLCKLVRELGFESLNFDLIYGLPHQTVLSFQKTIEQVVAIQPDRIAIYHYAHVPWLKSHQKLIDETSLPDSSVKLEIFLNARKVLIAHKYAAIGLDHFALETDEMSKAYREGVLYRNFMGYTVKPADEYLGFGVSSIGFVENMYIQNEHDLKRYYDALNMGALPIEKGMVLSRDDEMRHWVIQKIMCQNKVSFYEFNHLFNAHFETYFSAEILKLNSFIDDQFLVMDLNELLLTDLGKLFSRNIASVFDVYMGKNSSTQYSKTV